MRKLDRNTISSLAVGFVMAWVPDALAADALTFGTNWQAQAEHGGFYQAVAAGLYGE